MRSQCPHCPSHISRFCLSLVCRGCALGDDAEGSITAHRAMTCNKRIDRPPGARFELRRPLLAFRSRETPAGERVSLQTSGTSLIYKTMYLALRRQTSSAACALQWRSQPYEALVALVEPPTEPELAAAARPLAAAQSIRLCASCTNGRPCAICAPVTHLHEPVLVGKRLRVAFRSRIGHSESDATALR